ncbi:MAG: cysteine--tRNA ligase [Verrucomicrobia bacterium]|nr:cysteine--tRNA ligase [Verrucomicrobiota bacterium]
MEEVRLFDTATRSVKPLSASDGEALKFYACGPTVYGPAHIGNFRTFVVQDLLVRVWEAAGGKVDHVRNLTDVDDKTIRGAREAKLPLGDFTSKWAEIFIKDGKSLGLTPPMKQPKATDFVPQQIDLVERLVKAGHAYEADGSVYFRVKSFPGYGKLSRLDEREVKEGASGRADADEYAREQAADFVLWKAHKEEDGEVFWESPWGKGRPGWHLECSAMAMQIFGETIDLHGGGSDLIFPHHENEIAQSEAATGKPFVKHWFHVAHLLVENRKMSKSLGNLHTLKDVIRHGWDAFDLRLVLLSGHYRQPLNFSWDTMTAARHGRERLGRVRSKLEEAAKGKKAGAEEWGSFRGAWDALREDLETPKALAALYTAASTVEHKRKAGMSDEDAAKELAGLDHILEVFGVSALFEKQTEAPAEMKQLAKDREIARNAKDWTESDRLRDELALKGWEVRDGAGGWRLVRKPGTP